MSTIVPQRIVFDEEAVEKVPPTAFFQFLHQCGLEATFALREKHPGVELRVRVSDRSETRV